MLRTIAPHVEEALTAPERLSLAGDEWALVRAGRHTVADYLTLITGFRGERSSGVLTTITGPLATIREYVVTDVSRPQFEEFVRRLLRPMFAELGFASKPADSDDRRELRAALIGTLGTTGDDPDVVAQARAALDHALAGGPPLDPTLATPIVSVAARHGDQNLYDALRAAADRAESPEERYRFLFALGDFRDSALIDRGLQQVLSPQLRSQDTALYLARHMANPVARPRAWAFIMEHWSELQPKIFIAEGDTTLVHSLSTFCDARSRDDIKSFFASHPLPTAARTLSQTIERIDNCIAMREKQAPVLASWLDSR
jgi:aminopeptidase N